MSAAPFDHPLLARLLSEPHAAALFSAGMEFAAMLAFEQALALAEEEEGVIPPGAGAAIAEALDTFAPDGTALAAATRRDGLPTVELVRQLRVHVGAPHAQHVHFGATSQDVIELNEAFASQALASLRLLGLADDAAHVNPNGGAIALGHPLGMSGARITGTAALELYQRKGSYALAAMCVGVGQGIAIALERV